MYKICVYVPQTHLQQIKDSLFSVGAGKIGNYDSCCWQVLGEGQFRPLKGSTPYIGQMGGVETVKEYKVELVCEDVLVEAAIKSMRQAHPYEEPAYDVWKLEDF